MPAGVRPRWFSSVGKELNADRLRGLTLWFKKHSVNPLISVGKGLNSGPLPPPTNERHQGSGLHPAVTGARLPFRLMHNAGEGATLEGRSRGERSGMQRETGSSAPPPSGPTGNTLRAAAGRPDADWQPRPLHLSSVFRSRLPQGIKTNNEKPHARDIK